MGRSGSAPPLACAPGLVLPWDVTNPRVESVALAASKFADVRESLITGGPAHEKSLDEHLAAQTSQATLNAFASDWLATAEAFYYVTPIVGSVYRWDWDLTGAITRVRRGPAFATLELGLCGGAAPLRLKMSRVSAENLTAVVQWVGSRDRRPAPGWYSDPNGHPWLRYWDGSAWSDYFAIETARRQERHDGVNGVHAPAD